VTREIVDQISLGKGKGTNSATEEPYGYEVLGLPPHLHAEILPGFKCTLRRDGETFSYRQERSVPTAEAALSALKKLLTWEPL
jgi:hypothetical protein